MNVDKLSQEVKMQQWANLIKTCRESELSVKEWCKQNNIAEQTYYYWLKKIREKLVEQTPIQADNPETKTTFIPIEFNSVAIEKKKTSKIIINKDDIHIEVPETINEDLMMNIVRSLLC